MFDGFSFRDINEYKTAFSRTDHERPQSRPEQRPWLESHLESQNSRSDIHTQSEPVQSLMHSGESRDPKLTAFSESVREGQFEEERSPYLIEFRHSMSLDFSLLDSFDSHFP
jgi:hypothetical protein